MKIYQIKITLEQLRPPIWRRVLVPAEIRLPELHMVIQKVMGWHNCHLHQFVVGEDFYGELDEMNDWVKNEARVALWKIAPAVGSKFRYEYDFGDGWTHQVLLEKIVPAEAGQTYPVCVKGKRACPPEDCGGPWGYAGLLDALAGPAHEDHEDMRDWVDEDFDPEAFDLAAVNALLHG